MTTQQPTDIISMLQELAKQKQGNVTQAQTDLGLAQRLRDERLNFARDAAANQESVINDYSLPNGRVANPQDVWSAKNSFLGAVEGAINPMNTRVQEANQNLQSADASVNDIFKLLIDAQKANTTQVKPPSYTEQRQAEKDGYVWKQDDNGEWVLGEKEGEWNEKEKSQGRINLNHARDMIKYGNKYQLDSLYGTIRLGKASKIGDSKALGSARTALKNLAGNLELDASGLIKGQGQVSNAERMILQNAASVINNKEADHREVLKALMELEVINSAYLGEKSVYAEQLANYAKQNPDYVPPESLYKFVSEDSVKSGGNTYAPKGWDDYVKGFKE